LNKKEKTQKHKQSEKIRKKLKNQKDIENQGLNQKINIKDIEKQ